MPGRLVLGGGLDGGLGEGHPQVVVLTQVMVVQVRVAPGWPPPLSPSGSSAHLAVLPASGEHRHEEQQGAREPRGSGEGTLLTGRT